MPKNGTFNIAVYALNNDASKNVEICYQSVTIPSEEPKVLLGDADGNGSVEITDATIIQRRISNLLVPYPDETLMNADVDGNGELSILDVTYLQYHIANITVPYSIGEPIT